MYAHTPKGLETSRSGVAQNIPHRCLRDATVSNPECDEVNHRPRRVAMDYGSNSYFASAVLTLAYEGNSAFPLSPVVDDEDDDSDDGDAAWHDDTDDDTDAASESVCVPALRMDLMKSRLEQACPYMAVNSASPITSAATYLQPLAHKHWRRHFPPA